MSLLNLKHYTYTILDETEHDIHIQITLKDTTKPICSECRAKEVLSYGKRVRHFMDIPIRSKRVGLNINVPRYKCKKMH